VICGSFFRSAKCSQLINDIMFDGNTMDKLPSKLHARLLCLVLVLGSSSLFAFELLSEGAMGTVSAISANSAEDIVNIAGSTAAGLRIDDDYESLPFQSSVSVAEDETDEVSTELDFALTQEVETWAEGLRTQSSDVVSTESKIGYVDVLPESSFDDAVFFIRDDEFDEIIFDPGSGTNEEDSTVYELGRVEQSITLLEQNLDSIRYVVERRVEFAATIDAHLSDDTPSMGSGYISDLRSLSNVMIATVRD